MYNRIGSQYDHFIRTTDTKHVDTVNEFIDKCGSDIYLAKYNGFYNVREESFVTQLDAYKHTDTSGFPIDPQNGLKLDVVDEDSYFFKLSKYKNQPAKVIPQTYQANVTRVEPYNDMSISRLNIDWSIKFKTNQQHSVHVWFDALLNYITGTRILYDSIIPKTINIIGKDIIYFHNVVYDAILESAGCLEYKPIKTIVHGFVVDRNGVKMSKSLNNVVPISSLFDKFPICAIRNYFIMNTNSLDDDIKYSDSLLTESYIKITSTYGNLFQRFFNLVKISDVQQLFNNLLEENSCTIALNHLTYRNI
jgi:methionyl-tRNA synthetase